jgi:hypothetical protein
MRLTYTNGKLRTEFEGTQADVFGQLAQFQEVFEESKCGKCNSDDLRYVVRENDGNKYYELHCKKCRAKLAFGQHKNEQKTLFPKRKASANDPTGLEKGAWLPDRGWLRWDPAQQKVV